MKWPRMTSFLIFPFHANNFYALFLEGKIAQADSKKGVPKDALDLPTQTNYWTRIWKNIAGTELLTGMALENAPLPLRTPVALVTQSINGNPTLVELSIV